MQEGKMDFLVIGAQKCATTWIYECLEEHPQLCLPLDKKEVEYLGGDIYRQKGADWYFSLVSHAKDNQVKGDVSVEYIFNPASPQLVKDLLPGIKLIASLRNPAERAISAYYWYQRKNILPADKNIAETFAYLKDNYEKGNRDLAGMDIVARGMYDSQLQRYIDLFGIQQLMVILYDEVEHSPERVLNKLYAYLGVDNAFVPKSLHERPKRNSYIKWLVAFERLNPKSRVIAAISNRLNQLMSSKAKRPEYSAVEIEAYNILSGLFKESMISTEKLVASLPILNQPINTASILNWNKPYKKK